MKRTSGTLSRPEQARDLLNLQGMDFVKGFTATRILKLSVLKMMPVLFESIETDDDTVRTMLAHMRDADKIYESKNK